MKFMVNELSVIKYCRVYINNFIEFKMCSDEIYGT